MFFTALLSLIVLKSLHIKLTTFFFWRLHTVDVVQQDNNYISALESMNSLISVLFSLRNYFPNLCPRSQLKEAKRIIYTLYLPALEVGYQIIFFKLKELTTHCRWFWQMWNSKFSLANTLILLFSVAVSYFCPHCICYAIFICVVARMISCSSFLSTAFMFVNKLVFPCKCFPSAESILKPFSCGHDCQMVWMRELMF